MQDKVQLQALQTDNNACTCISAQSLCTPALASIPKEEHSLSEQQFSVLTEFLSIFVPAHSSKLAPPIGVKKCLVPAALDIQVKNTVNIQLYVILGHDPLLKHKLIFPEIWLYYQIRSSPRKYVNERTKTVWIGAWHRIGAVPVNYHL